jgi:hypothetical protein
MRTKLVKPPCRIKLPMLSLERAKVLGMCRRPANDVRRLYLVPAVRVGPDREEPSAPL